MRLRTLLIVLAACLLLLCAGGYVVARYLGGKLADMPLAKQSCTVTADGVVTLDAEQLGNAATIAAVGIRRQLPERAVVVALATAYQESKIRNLSGGDRDSVGLFQQRPSQGWGTVEQISDQRYAAGKFYDKLVKIPGWEKMRVTDAAQAVQISAHPELYQQWADESEILARALQGTAVQAVTCTLGSNPATRGAEAAKALDTSVQLDWGTSGTVEGGAFSLPAVSNQVGWRYAHWLVARAEEHGVRSVRFAGLEWTAKSGGWSRTTAATGDRVTAEVYA
ncbi:hypothetical protein [Longispora albida]|uniref:hypothetical protein n=1 Tax=Longispora albida TaxID=203523 RepID=UPI0003630249|nr:hypothetical protein [Longispora albida]